MFRNLNIQIDDLLQNQHFFSLSTKQIKVNYLKKESYKQ